MAKKEINNLAKAGVQGANKDAKIGAGAEDAATIAARKRADQAAEFRSEIFDDLMRVVDDFLVACALNFDSEEGVNLNSGPLVEALEIVAPGYFDRMGKFSEGIVGTGKKRRFDLEEEHSELSYAEQQASFLLGLIFAVRLLGAGPEKIQRIRGVFTRLENLEWTMEAFPRASRLQR